MVQEPPFRPATYRSNPGRRIRNSLILRRISRSGITFAPLRGMEATIPEVKVERQDRVIERHLLGLGVLVVTLTTGYMLTGLSGVRQVPPAPRPEVARVEGTEGDATPGEDDIDTQAGMDAFIKKVSAKYNVSPDVVAAVIEAESEFNPRAVSRRGARGLMQLMPVTAADYGIKRDKLDDPEANVEAGVQHLKMLSRLYDGDIPLIAAAYNAGQGMVAKFDGIPPFEETQTYVERVLSYYNSFTV